MSTPYEAARLNLQLFEMRREPSLREAISWFLKKFRPSSSRQFDEALSSSRNDSFLMVVGYWDMAASLVTSGAIDRDSFLAAHGEIVTTFSRVEPFLSRMRAASGDETFCLHMERLVRSLPGVDAMLARSRAATPRDENP